MAQDVNKVVIIGNVTRDIELRAVGNGQKTATFSIACNGPTRQDGTHRVDYPTIVVWDKLAEVCAQYLHKGSKVAVEGRLQTRSYERNGTKVYVTEIAPSQIQFLTPKGAPQDAYAPPAEPAPGSDFTEVEDDQLPFD